MAFFAGIDVGSVTTKVVITRDSELTAYHVIPSGANYKMAAQKAMEEVLAKAGLSLEDIAYIVATGYGAGNVEFANQQVTDITCCAKGVNRLFPAVRTIIDIGGQASKAIRVNAEGRTTNFVVTEKCAAGSGRFLQIIARVLQIELGEVGPLSLQAKKPVIYTTACAVFGESEAISRVAEGTPKEDILAGVHNAMALKIYSLVNGVGLEEECAIAGGGALDVGLVKRLEEKIGVHLLVPPQPQIMAALGAALMAEERAPALAG
ncbi:MAG: acyl-CoA dehydratase activase [Dehalococcoidia bacterium]